MEKTLIVLLAETELVSRTATPEETVKEWHEANLELGKYMPIIQKKIRC